MNRYSKAVLAAAAAALIFTSYADSAAEDTGIIDTSSDPLVSLSYVNDVLKPQLTAEILNQVSELINSQTPAPETPGEYEVVHLTAGQTLLANGALELVLRSGQGNAVVYLKENLSNGVGLSDLTAGSEITNGQPVPRNHYIIVPRADGRGVTITSRDAYLMVRGEYEIVSQ